LVVGFVFGCDGDVDVVMFDVYYWVFVEVFGFGVD